MSKTRFKELKGLVHEACDNRDHSFEALSNVVELHVLETKYGETTIDSLRSTIKWSSRSAQSLFSVFLKKYEVEV